MQVAKVTIKMPDDFLMKISKLGNRTDEIAEKALEAGGELVYKKVKSNLQSVIGSGTKEKSCSTGELVSALGLSPVKQDRDGYNIKIGFSEPRSDGESNSMIGSILENGKSGQPAKPFAKPAKSSTRKACIEKMKDVYERETSL